MGVYSRENKDKSVSWVIQYFVNGRRKREVVPVKTRKEAELALAKRKIEIKEGRFWDIKKEINLLFKDWAEEYLKIKELQGRKSLRRMKTSVKNLVKFFGNYYLNEITPALIDTYINKRRYTKSPQGTLLAPATINRELAQLKNLLNTAVENGNLEKSPIRRGIMLKENNERDRVLSTEEYERLINAANESLKGIILTAYNTGMRAGEILRLTWDRIDLKEGLITLRPEDTKTSEGRIIPLNHELIEYFLNLPRHIRCPYVFHNQGKKYTYYRTAWTTALKKAGIRDFKFHDLRHTFITNKRREGIHDFVIMAITGHKTMSVFRRYNTVDIEDLKKAVQQNPPENPHITNPAKSATLSIPKVPHQVPHKKNTHQSNELST